MDKSFNCDWMKINDGLCPGQSFQVVEDGPDWDIIESNLGMRMKRGKSNASIPQYLKFPVSDMGDYEKISAMLDPGSAERYSDDFYEDLAARTKRGEVRGVNFSALFGFARELMGLENYCTAIYDYPELVQKILDDRVDMAKNLYKKATSVQGIDFVQIWEDMAYKSGPLVSPDFMENNMLDRYIEICGELRGDGVRLIMMDCDGYIDEIVPIVQRAGIDGIYPCEMASDSDPLKLRKKFPGVALMGGVDKRALAQDGKDGAKSELRRLQPLLKDGGFIPFIDHHIPPDIAFDTFDYYIRLKTELLANPDMKI